MPENTLMGLLTRAAEDGADWQSVPLVIQEDSDKTYLSEMDPEWFDAVSIEVHGTAIEGFAMKGDENFDSVFVRASDIDRVFYPQAISSVPA